MCRPPPYFVRERTPWRHRHWQRDCPSRHKCGAASDSKPGGVGNTPQCQHSFCVCAHSRPSSRHAHHKSHAAVRHRICAYRLHDFVADADGVPSTSPPWGVTPTVRIDRNRRRPRVSVVGHKVPKHAFFRLELGVMRLFPRFGPLPRNLRAMQLATQPFGTDLWKVTLLHQIRVQFRH